MKNEMKDPALKMPTPAEIGGETTPSQLRLFLLDALKDIYWAEQQLTQALPVLSAHATTPQLKSAIQEHLIQTQTHVKRLEDAFDFLGEKAEGKKCEAMAGLIKE